MPFKAFHDHRDDDKCVCVAPLRAKLQSALAFKAGRQFIRQ